MLMFIPTYGILFLIRFFVMITKYTVLDEQRCEAKVGKSYFKTLVASLVGLLYDILVSEINSINQSGFSLHQQLLNFSCYLMTIMDKNITNLTHILKNRPMPCFKLAGFL